MSPRLKKPRKCSCKFKGNAYKPTGVPIGSIEKVQIGVDELEALRLCDKMGLTQLEAGREMGVSRGTVQRILSSARMKVADALTGCKALVMDEAICSGKNDDNPEGV